MIRAKLQNAKFDRVTLRELDLREDDMSGASFKRANLIMDFMTNANMSGADLSDATLNQLEMTGVDLRGANLQHVTYDQFTLRSLAKAKLDGAKMSDNLKADLKAMSQNLDGHANLTKPYVS